MLSFKFKRTEYSLAWQTPFNENSKWKLSNEEMGARGEKKNYSKLRNVLCYERKRVWLLLLFKCCSLHSVCTVYVFVSVCIACISKRYTCTQKHTKKYEMYTVRYCIIARQTPENTHTHKVYVCERVKSMAFISQVHVNKADNANINTHTDIQCQKFLMSCYSIQKNVNEELGTLCALSLSHFHCHRLLRTLDNFVCWKLLRGVSYELRAKGNRLPLNSLSLSLSLTVSLFRCSIIFRRAFFLCVANKILKHQQLGKCRSNTSASRCVHCAAFCYVEKKEQRASERYNWQTNEKKTT